MIKPGQKVLPHLLRPTRGGAAAVLIVFAVLLSFAAKAGLLGLPLALLLISWFFKYAYILFDHTARGFDEPPTLDIKMMNPVDEQRPLAQLAIFGLIYVAVRFVGHTLGAAFAEALAVIAALCLPASIAILGLEGNIFKAAYPVAWVRMVVGLGPKYFIVLAVIAGYALFIWIAAKWELWLSVEIAIFMYCILSVFSVLGGVLYERRHELDLETWVSPERTADLKRARDLRDADREVTAAYGQVRAGAHTQAWASLQNWLASRGHGPDDYRWLCERVASWGDPRYLTRLTEDHVERLLAAKRTGEALDVVARRLDLDPTFRPKPQPTHCKSPALPRRGRPEAGGPRPARRLPHPLSRRPQRPRRRRTRRPFGPLACAFERLHHCGAIRGST